MLSAAFALVGGEVRASSHVCLRRVYTSRTMLCSCVELFVLMVIAFVGVSDSQSLKVPSRNSITETISPGTNVYRVDGYDLKVQYVNDSLQLTCTNTSQLLKCPPLPSLQSLMSLSHVTLRNCLPPSSGYGKVLAALNVSLSRQLELSDLPVGSRLHSDHFEGLSGLLHLVVRYNKNNANFASSHYGSRINSNRSTLVDLELDDPLESLPESLQGLSRIYTGVSFVRVPSATKLKTLMVAENDRVTVDIRTAPNLEKLTVSSSGAKLEIGTQVGSLRQLSLQNWLEKEPAPWTDCFLVELELLYTVNVDSVRLPVGWLEQCSQLKKLSVKGMTLASLKSTLFLNAKSLIELTLSKCRLETLPIGLFDDTHLLEYIDLTKNRLKSLPSDLFSKTTGLRVLLLSGNLLTTKDMSALAPLNNLRTLDLSYNEKLSDLCNIGGGGGVVKAISGLSLLHHMAHLETLKLQHTGVTRVCEDWQKRMKRLRILDLSYTNINVLKYDDLIQTRDVPNAKIMIINKKDKLIRFEFSSTDYNIASSELHPGLNAVTIKGHVFVICDCTAYWAALVFRKTEFRSRLSIQARCTSHENGLMALDMVPLESLECAAPNLCASEEMRGCKCTKHEKNATAFCEDAGLTAVPRVSHSDLSWRFLLANNNIKTINRSDLPQRMRGFNLTGNKVETLSAETIIALRGIPVSLSKNPLDCGCKGLALLRALEMWGAAAGDVRCRDGQRPPSAEYVATVCTREEAERQALSVALPALLLTLLALAMLVALSNAEVRLRIKILLWRMGLGDNTEEVDGCHYDAFISHAHEDEQWVRELVVRLEDVCGYRVCVHYRDWAPGEWIPAQIAASVRTSRRTIAVMSRHFLSSCWARLEFREAQAQSRRDTKSRLVVVLMEEPSSLPLDKEMRSFIENNTYVRCGDPWFWRKLEHAMPRRHRTTKLKTRQHEEPG